MHKCSFPPGRLAEHRKCVCVYASVVSSKVGQTYLAYCLDYMVSNEYDEHGFEPQSPNNVLWANMIPQT